MGTKGNIIGYITVRPRTIVLSDGQHVELDNALRIVGVALRAAARELSKATIEERSTGIHDVDVASRVTHMVVDTVAAIGLVLYEDDDFEERMDTIDAAYRHIRRIGTTQLIDTLNNLDNGDAAYRVTESDRIICFVGDRSWGDEPTNDLYKASWAVNVLGLGKIIGIG